MLYTISIINACCKCGTKTSDSNEYCDTCILDYWIKELESAKIADYMPLDFKQKLIAKYEKQISYLKTKQSYKTYIELIELESKNMGITCQELAKRKVVVKRQLRQLGFSLSSDRYYDLGLLHGVLDFADMTDKDYLLTNGVSLNSVTKQ